MPETQDTPETENASDELIDMIEDALREDFPDEGDWPTGDQVELIVHVTRRYDQQRS